MIENEKLVDKVLELYQIPTIEALAIHIGVSRSTLQTWRTGKLSRIGEILLKTLIENHELKEKEAITMRFFEAFAPKKDLDNGTSTH